MELDTLFFNATLRQVRFLTWQKTNQLFVALVLINNIEL